MALSCSLVAGLDDVLSKYARAILRHSRLDGMVLGSLGLASRYDSEVITEATDGARRASPMLPIPSFEPLKYLALSSCWGTSIIGASSQPSLDVLLGAVPRH